MRSLIATDLFTNPWTTEDLSNDDLVMVHSFVNAASNYAHSRAALPPPPTGPDAKRHAATALRWIDEPPRTKTGERGNARGPGSCDQEAWEITGSRPILGVNEAVEWIEDPPPPDTTRSL